MRRQFNEEIYFHRELLTFSLEHRNVELITITSKANVTEDEKEEGIEGLFPEERNEEKDRERFSYERCLRVKQKQCVFFSSRVHPGEIQSSFVLNGIVNFLVSK